MLKDIQFEKVNNIALAMVPEPKEGSAIIWYSYIINLKKITITDILINSKGYGQVDNEQRKTSTLRYFLEKLGPQEFFKIEPINPELLHLAHEFWVSFREKDKMLDKKYIFLPETIKEDNLIDIPTMNTKGVLII